ncbi:uncharacterized protein LOC130793457 [Actinidia eriantha]|uniref:uncharacterized protein LOC130793457 n=1 Tax=Actinidia eriantha TaxID=165200 RepID=UPI002584DF3C|nr:uncharacterized protein LOC130793457 [Actinidia eriantha]
MYRINRCNLTDTGSSGSKLTWTNGRSLDNTLVRLDREACIMQKGNPSSPKLLLRTPKTYSDHYPLIIFTQGGVELKFGRAKLWTSKSPLRLRELADVKMVHFILGSNAGPPSPDHSHVSIAEVMMSIPVFVHSKCESSKSHSSSSSVTNNEKYKPTKIPWKSIKAYNRKLMLCQILFYVMDELKRFVSCVIQ